MLRPFFFKDYMIYDYCIWDFNGTILDDVELGMNCVNTLLSERGLPVIPSREVYRKRFDFPIIDYYRELGFDFERDPYEELAQLWIDLYMRDLEDAKMFEGAERAFEFFEKRVLSKLCFLRLSGICL